MLWERYLDSVEEVARTPTQVSVISKDAVALKDGMTKTESSFAEQVYTERIKLKVFLYTRKVPGVDLLKCFCGWER